MAARPKTLIAGLAPVLLGLAIASADGPVRWGLAALTLVAAISLQIGVNFVNDLLDFQTGVDAGDRVGPRRVMQSGFVREGQMRLAIAAAFAVCTAAGLTLSLQAGVFVLVIGLAGIVMGLLYTAGTSLLSRLGLSEVMVICFFGVLAAAGTVYVQNGSLAADAFLAGLGPGLLSTAILTVNNVRDEAQDRRAGRRTWVVRFGSLWGRYAYVACLSGAAAVPVLSLARGDAGPAALAATASVLLGVPLVRQLWQLQGHGLNRTLGQTAGLLLLYTGMFALGWLA